MSDRHRNEKKIEALAFLDQLTGLPNRTLLMDRLRQAIAGCARNGSFGGLLFIDMDNFKTLNDTKGHDVGDMLLKEVARRLMLCVRETDTVARLGGDEFVVVAPDVGRKGDEAAAAVETLGEKILHALNQPYQLGSIAHSCTASVGATLFKGDRAFVEDLLKQADLAMYKSKDTGRNAFRFFDPLMEAAVHDRAAREADLRDGVAMNQFVVYYQAQIGAAGRLIGAEALIRWNHPRRGVVLPVEFIPLAEETGLILPLGLMVLETACDQLAAWAGRPDMAALRIAVNVSARQFQQPDFVDQVLAALRRSGADPKQLKLELTESVLVNNLADVVEKMAALKEKGVGFSLDDFGTGYSSLSYLKSLPLEQLKIDRSFIGELMTSANDASIAKTVVALAEALGLDVIAEGVETEAQRDFLNTIGCQNYQGYFFGRPVPIERFEELLRGGAVVADSTRALAG
jgi:diguanylate cyclase (GGDEF)-like protein